MAKMGLKYLAWAKMLTEPESAPPTYAPGKIIARMVSMNVAITNSEGEMHADDMLAEYASEFSSGEFTADTDNISLDVQAELYGARMVDGEFRAHPDDTPPYGMIAGIQVKIVRGVRKFCVWVYPKVKAIMPDVDAATKAASISFGAQPVKAKILAPLYGPWYIAKEFDAEPAAKAYMEGKAGVAVWHEIDVHVQGATGEQAATPEGVTMVAADGTFELAISGAPSALYDNGAEVSASISGGKYTLQNVESAHRIAVIF